MNCNDIDILSEYDFSDARPNTYQVRWSAEDREFVGTCTQYPSLSWLAPTKDEALKGIKNLVAEADDMAFIEQITADVWND